MAEDQNPGERTQGSADAALVATREILSAISAHRGDEKPVFDVILENACRLCNAQTAFVAALDGAETHLVIPAWRGASDAFADGLKEFRHEVTETHLTAVQAMVQRRVIRIDDISDTDTYRQGEPVRVFMVDVENIRSLATVPLLRGDRGIGSILLYRRQVDPFTDDDIALVETFAAQAVIAIENVRQFRAIQTANAELETRLEREAATRQILGVISQSRDDEAPVFDVILENAARLCAAPMAGLVLLNDAGDTLDVRGFWGDPDQKIERPSAGFAVDSDVFPARAFRAAEILHIPDITKVPEYAEGNPRYVALVEEMGFCAYLGVPLFQNGKPIGCIDLFRTTATPFDDRQIELIETFAVQAVIAIENVRQFRELQERLQREAATKNVLRVISESRDDDGPVFDAILESAAHLCDAKSASLMLLNDEGTHNEFQRVFGRELERKDSQLRWALNSGQAHTEAVRTGAVIHITDLRDTELYRNGDETRTRLVDEVGVSTALSVPILRDQVAIGAIALTRHGAPRPFSDNDIQLVEAFAAQAVIAIDNVRQFRELQERLEREAATREILSVISQSRDDDTPVFEIILEKAAQLCGAPLSRLLLADKDYLNQTLAASWGEELRVSEVGMVMPMNPSLFTSKSIIENKVLASSDLRESDAYLAKDATAIRAVDGEGLRSILSVPLANDGVAIGTIIVARREVAPFTNDDIALLKTFAEQAVIAIENVRQFRELQERLEREAATREVLQVISQSRNDDAPVFDVILQSAARLCGCHTARLLIADDEMEAFCIAANWGSSQNINIGEFLPMNPLLMPVRSMLENIVVSIDDARESEAYKARSDVAIRMVDEEGIRTFLSVPLTRDGKAIGALALSKKQVEPFTEDEIALVGTFADQAVIAIENVRQFKALETLNAELGDRVESQVGEIERMGRLKRFLPPLSPTRLSPLATKAC